ncbi:MAG: hypothetical protein KF708_17400 [Pirellulales bacterium]|nr:hypothetical protein [Pirellulales bacterium]
MAAWTTVNAELLGARRWRGFASSAARASAAEVAWLLALGGLASCLLALVHVRVPLPGHVILLAALPVAAGLATVPRSTSGTIVSAGGGIGALLLAAGGVGGGVQSAALVGLLVLGPVLDLMLRGNVVGWRLYAKFLAAGGVANLAAFAVRLLLALAQMDPPGSRPFLSFWPAALASFLACGAVAGLLSAAVCFRPPMARSRSTAS